MPDIDKKLREARYFLRKMKEREALAFGDHEEFDFLLSAFLNAGRTLDYRVRHIATKQLYDPFRAAWEKTLNTNELQLIKFMIDDRGQEVHATGSTRKQGEVAVPIKGNYSDASGRVIVTNSLPGTPPAEFMKPTYDFSIDGKQVAVLDACDKYVRLLERFVADCRAVGIV
jgi:hypothetical protein